MPRFRIPLVLAIAAAVASLVAASALGAIVKRIDSTVTLAKKNPFHGHVSSPNGGCEQVRTVKVFKKRHGPNGLYNSTTTDNDGKWSIPATPAEPSTPRSRAGRRAPPARSSSAGPTSRPRGTSAAVGAATSRATRAAGARQPQGASN